MASLPNCVRNNSIVACVLGVGMSDALFGWMVWPFGRFGFTAKPPNVPAVSTPSITPSGECSTTA